MSVELLYRKLTPLEKFHHFVCKNLVAQIGDQKDYFHLCVQGNTFVLHSSHICQEPERLPAVLGYHAMTTFIYRITKDRDKVTSSMQMNECNYNKLNFNILKITTNSICIC